MGPDESPPVAFFVDGRRVSGLFHSVSIIADDAPALCSGAFNSDFGTVEISFAVRLRRISRKRCVKILMSLGHGRNSANRLARVGALIHGSYAQFIWPHGQWIIL